MLCVDCSGIIECPFGCSDNYDGAGYVCSEGTQEGNGSIGGSID